MSKERVCHVFNLHLGMRKLSARWVPRLLTLDQKRVRMNIANAVLALFRHNKSEFWHNSVQTVDCKGGTDSKKAKTFFSAGKVMATVFWDSHGVILIDYLQKGKTIKGA